MSQLSSAAIATRTITVYSSQGKNGNAIEFTGSTWGELKKVLRANNYNVDEMTAIESINRHELSLDNAVIPEVDFYLHLHPVETKSGAKATVPTKKALIEEIKATSEGNEEATAFFKGYSKLSAEELNEQLKKWNKKAAAKAKKAAAPKAATKSTTKAPKKAAAKKATSTDVLAAAPVSAVTVTARDPQEVQNEYNETRNELKKAHNGRWSRVK